jgi:hypothetical protein
MMSLIAGLSPSWPRNSIVFGAKFTCIRISGVRMARHVGQVGSALANNHKCRNPVFPRQNQKYGVYFALSESCSRSPLDGRENEKRWLFETSDHNLLGEPGRGRDFITYIGRNPLKRLDSEK